MRPRIAEALDFVKEMGFHKIGFAACLAFEHEMKTIREIFVKEELDPIIVGCQIGNSTPGDRGVAELLKYSNSTCNPIGQAEILNEESTQLNFIVGLCMGHDILFSEYSRASVSTLVVKDRMTGNNPGIPDPILLVRLDMIRHVRQIDLMLTLYFKFQGSISKIAVVNFILYPLLPDSFV